MIKMSTLFWGSFLLCSLKQLTINKKVEFLFQFLNSEEFIRVPPNETVIVSYKLKVFDNFPSNYDPIVKDNWTTDISKNDIWRVEHLTNNSKYNVLESDNRKPENLSNSNNSHQNETQTNDNWKTDNLTSNTKNDIREIDNWQTENRNNFSDNWTTYNSQQAGNSPVYTSLKSSKDKNSKTEKHSQDDGESENDKVWYKGTPISDRVGSPANVYDPFERQNFLRSERGSKTTREFQERRRDNFYFPNYVPAEN